MRRMKASCQSHRRTCGSSSMLEEASSRCSSSNLGGTFFTC
jgi:hypothetical protein